MNVENLTPNYLYFSGYSIAPGATIVVSDTDYNKDDILAAIINSASTAGTINVTSPPSGFPRSGVHTGSNGGGEPSGPAGGDLGGTYPNPTVPDLIPESLLDAKGDMIAASAADTAARLAIGANGTVLTVDSTQVAGAKWAAPVAQELAYAEVTADVTCTATTDATADVIVTAAAITGDGVTAILIEFFAPFYTGSSTTGDLVVTLYDGAAGICRLCQMRIGVGANFADGPLYLAWRIVPSAASHTYSIRGWATAGNMIIKAGAGTQDVTPPAFIRITKAA